MKSRNRFLSACVMVTVAACGGNNGNNGNNGGDSNNGEVEAPMDAGREDAEVRDTGDPVERDSGGSEPDAATEMDGDGPDAGGAVTGIVEGRIYDARAVTALQGATLTFADGTSVQTDADGRFDVGDVPVGEHVVRVQAPEFADAVRRVEVFEGVSSYIEVFVAPVQVRATFLAEQGGGAIDPSTGARALFAANSLVDKNGQIVSGEVDIALALVDPSEPTSLRSFPGEFAGVRADNSEVGIETYGPMEITVTSGNEVLDIAAGESAAVSFPIYDDNAPETIPLWSLDEETGLWTEEGVAYRATDESGQPVYRASITHMSWWNPDKPIERTCLRACVTDQGDPVAGAIVSAIGVGYGYSTSGYTDQTGCTSLRVRRNSPVSLDAAALAGVAEAVVVDALDMPESPDPTECQMVAALELNPRPDDGCPSGLTRCEDECVDLARDSDSCGSCGTACGAEAGGIDSLCVAGVCSCPAPRIDCDGVCTDVGADRDSCGGCLPSGDDVDGVNGCAQTGGGDCCAPRGLTGCATGNGAWTCVDDLQTDSNHCGACFNECATGEECSGGACRPIQCPGSQNLCNGVCIDEPCGEACASEEVCDAGSCVPLQCQGNLDACDGQCANLQTDSQNCGACNVSCGDSATYPENAVCVSGACGCGNGATECNIGSGITGCYDLLNDRDHCGACDNACSIGQECAGGSCQAIQCSAGEVLCGNDCVVTDSDVNHCGGCTAFDGSNTDGGDGPGGSFCTEGGCRCSLPETECPTQPGSFTYECVDMNTDPTNCGTCGNTCSAAQECVGGSCQALSCPSGAILCGRDCVFGPSCGTDCEKLGGEFTCVAGACECPGGETACTPSDPDRDSYCTDITTDDANCGACDNACDLGFECANSQCVPVVCPAGEVFCGTSCIDPQTSTFYCGGCHPGGFGAGDRDNTCFGVGCCGQEDECPESTDVYLCTDFATDPENCGGCGTACSATEQCTNGTCQALACPSGQVACDRECVNGSSCGEECVGVQTCVNGTCQ